MGALGTFCLIVLAFLFPPAAALLVDGCSAQFLLNIVFTILGWIPGLLKQTPCIT